MRKPSFYLFVFLTFLTFLSLSLAACEFPSPPPQTSLSPYSNELSHQPPSVNVPASATAPSSPSIHPPLPRSPLPPISSSPARLRKHATTAIGNSVLATAFAPVKRRRMCLQHAFNETRQRIRPLYLYLLGQPWGFWGGQD